MEMLQKQEENSYNNELSYQDENWKVATAHKRRKIILNTSAIKIPDTEMHQWLQDIPLRNSFSSLIKDGDTSSQEEMTTHIVKPPPIYIHAQITDTLIELLNNTVGRENYSIKELKLEQVKVQTNTPKIFRKVVQVLNISYIIHTSSKQKRTTK